MGFLFFGNILKMAGNLQKWRAFGPLFTVVWSFILASIFVSAERSLKRESMPRNATGDSSRDSDSYLLTAVMNFLWQENETGYQHVWPVSLDNSRILDLLIWFCSDLVLIISLSLSLEIVAW